MEIFNRSSLYHILENSNKYPKEYIEEVFLDKENIIIMINDTKFDIFYNMILKLDNDKLNNYYLSPEFFEILKDNNKFYFLYYDYSFKDIEIDKKTMLLNEDNLDYIGKVVSLEYKMHTMYHWVGDISTFSSKYVYFVFLVCKLDEDDLYNVLDYYLTHVDYLAVFRIIRKYIPDDKYQSYLESRRHLITKIIEENENAETYLILDDRDQGEVLDGQFVGRENIMINCNIVLFTMTVGPLWNIPKKKIILPDKILNHPRFINKFIDTGYNIRKCLELVTDDEEYIDKTVKKIEYLRDLRNEMIKSFGDTKDEFKTYLQILDRSLLDDKPEFVNDMIDVIFNCDRIEELYEKYNGVNLEKMKLNLLNNIIKKSRESIVSSLTNPLEKRIVYVSYELDGEIVKIPTIIYDGDDYNFLIRRVQNGDFYHNGNYIDMEQSYSIITEKNRSVYYGGSGIICGYITVNHDDIKHVNSFDAISQCQESDKYVGPLLKYPEWITSIDLNKETLYGGSYNELRILGKYIPDFLISYDNPNDKSIRYLHNYGGTLVKILRKSYPNAIENFEDPYKDWK